MTNTELVRMCQLDKYAYPDEIHNYTSTELYAAIFSLWMHGRDAAFFMPEMRDNPTAILYRSVLGDWNIIGDWLLKHQFKLFDLSDTPYGEKYMLLNEPWARIAIAELDLMEGIFDAFGQLGKTEQLPWNSSVEGWWAVQIEKKSEALSNATKQHGIRKQSNKIRDTKKALTEYKNPYIHSIKTCSERCNMLELATLIATDKRSSPHQFFSKIRNRFKERVYDPYLEALQGLISCYRKGITLPDGSHHEIDNIFLKNNVLKICDDSGKPETVFPIPSKEFSLTQRGKYSRMA
jgi:hypothetical protein